MLGLQPIIQKTLREHKIIDSGVSEELAELLEPMVMDAIRVNADLIAGSLQCLSGILASDPEIRIDEAVPDSIAAAKLLFTTLQFQRENIDVGKSTKLDS